MLTETKIYQVQQQPEPQGFDALDEAIEEGVDQYAASQSLPEIEQNKKSRIEAVEWSDSSAVFLLENLNKIQFTATGQGVVWEIIPASDTPIRRGYPRRLQLDFFSDEAPHEWQRADILEQSIGVEFYTIVKCEPLGFFFYAGHGEPLLFSCLPLTGVEEPLLFWDLAE